MAEVLAIKKRGQPTLSYEPSQEVDISDDEYKPVKREGFSFDDKLAQKLKDLRRQYRKKLAPTAPIDDSLPKKRRRVEFIDNLAVYGAEDEVEYNPDDEFQREMQFYQVALENVKTAVDKLEALKVQIYRPDDYLVEMYKSEHHMNKIKNHLAVQEKRVEVIQKRRQETHGRKFASAAKKASKLARSQNRNRTKAKKSAKPNRPGKSKRAELRGKKKGRSS